MAETIYDCIVVGKGLAGSAAAKYLARELPKVAVIGPDEPANWDEHNGVFASHYDSGRITRILDQDRSCLWATIAKASIERYAQIESESGINFYSFKGCLKVAPDDKDGKEYIDDHRYVGDCLEVNYQELPVKELPDIYPFLKFPDHSIALVEHDTAGWINPLKLIEAQLVIAEKNGVDVFKETVTGKSINAEDNLIQLSTDSGSVYRTKKLLIAAGAFSNYNNLINKKLDVCTRGETVVLGEVSVETAERLETMPSIIWPVERGACRRIYIVPPALYPDRKYYIKIGAQACEQLTLTELEAVRKWFHTKGQIDVVEEDIKVLKELLPTTEFLSWSSKPCIITDTPSGFPYIGKVENNTYIVTGGNGYGAKSSDELGRLGAHFCLEKELEKLYENHRFDISYAGVKI